MPSRHVTPAQNATSACSVNWTSPRQSSPLVTPSCAACGTVHLPCRSCTTESSWPPSARRICGGRTTCLPDGTADHSSCTTTCPWPHSSTAALTRLAQLATELTTTAAGSAKHGRPSNNTVLHPVYGTLSDRPHVLHLGSGMVFQTDRVPFRQPGGCGRPPKRHRSLRQC